MYSVDAIGAQLLIGYSDVFSGETPDLKEEIATLNMHKAISIICELIRVRDAMLEPVPILWGEFRIPFETVLKKQMCDIDPKSPEEMFSNPLLRNRDLHQIRGKCTAAGVHRLSGSVIDRIARILIRTLLCIRKHRKSTFLRCCVCPGFTDTVHLLRLCTGTSRITGRGSRHLCLDRLTEPIHSIAHTKAIP